MSSIFDNMNTEVTRHRFGPVDARKVDIMSDSMLASQALRNISNKERQAIKEANEAAAHEYEKAQERLNRCHARELTENQLAIAIGQYNSAVKEACYKEILTELYTKSLLVDDDFVTEHIGDLSAVVSQYVDSKGGFKGLEEAVRTTNSSLLKKIKDICVETASKVSSRKVKEAVDTQDVNKLNLSLTSKEREEFEYKKSEISPDEIASLVKDKVLTVIKDEKTRQEKEDELRTAIEDELKDDETVVDDKTAKEALNSIIIGKSPVEETTLFNAIFRNACNESLISGMDKTSVDNTSDDINTSEDDIDDYAPGDDDDNYDNREIDMDMIFTEAVAQYTFMETLNTLCLENYTYNNIHSLIGKLIRPIKK